MQSYLQYIVKVMELAGKFEWLNVLRFDNDFKHIQALYNYPWLSESHPLHLNRLQPEQGVVAASADVQKAKRQPPFSATLGDGGTNNTIFTTDGHIICRNFNWSCQLAFSNFAHVRNRKVSGKACGQAH